MKTRIHTGFPPTKNIVGAQGAFTLIELSIVLVIIGLIIGGILTGRDLIKSAEIDAQVAQITSYNAAVHTFEDKYGFLPGDITPQYVGQFGFTVVPASQRAGTVGLGDGDNIVEGYNWGSGGPDTNLTSGEAAWFWEDLSSNSGLIDQNLHTAANTAQSYMGSEVGQSTLAINVLLPQAKIGGGNIFVYVYSVNGTMYYGLSLITVVDPYGAITSYSGPGISVIQAYNIDKKMDDGLPQTGQVIAKYQNWDLGNIYHAAVWAAGLNGANNQEGALDTSSTPGSATTCYDNNSTAGAAQHYSTEQSGGTSLNCALSFQFQ